MAGPQYDLLLRGGEVIDPSQGLHCRCDVALAKGVIVAVSDDIPVSDAGRVIDVSGKLVTPGLIDIHGHFFHGSFPLAARADEVCLPNGVTTGVDAGSSGWMNYPAFRDYVIPTCKTGVLAFLNLSGFGIGSPNLDMPGDLMDFRWASEERTIQRLEENRGRLLGIKVRIAHNACGKENAIPALKMARKVCDQTGTRLMVHVSGSPIPLSKILEFLHPGDIVTHVYNGHPNGVLDSNRRVLPAVREAREAGVILDVAHAGTHLNNRVARTAVEQGLPPDTLSTDMVDPKFPGRDPSRPTYYLPDVMSIFMALGMSLEEVVKGVTWSAASAIGEEARIGSLRPGYPSDVAVLEQGEGQFDFPDMDGNHLPATERLVCKMTIRQGEVCLNRLSDNA
ncbi:MAG: amidohydrolase family protein [Dehalococcoidia bacterium]